MSLTRFLDDKPVFFLTSNSGLIEYEDYIPVQEDTDGSLRRFDSTGVYAPSQVIENSSGLVAWVDYTPVFIKSSATVRWSSDTNGFQPISTAEAVDGDFANVASLLHFDGSDGSTTFTDETGKTWTVNGNAQIDTAQSQFGGASGLFDGTGDSIDTADNDDWSFGAEDFTVELWIRHGADPTLNARWISKWTEAVNQREWTFGSLATGNLRFSYSVDGSAAVNRDQAWTAVANTWHHVCAMRSGNTLYFFLDGVALGNAVIADLFSGSSICRIGDGVDSGVGWAGHIDDVRVTKGVARYPTGGFVPPVGPFPNE